MSNTIDSAKNGAKRTRIGWAILDFRTNHLTSARHCPHLIGFPLWGPATLPQFRFAIGDLVGKQRFSAQPL